MDGRSIFWEVHEGLPQQAPGSDATTRHLLSCCTPLPASPAVLDVGCGPGRSTVSLAAALPTAMLTGVDLYQPFLDELATAAAAAGVDQRVDRVRASMTELPFEDSQFDLIWSEGAIYLMGVEAGLRAWRRLLRPRGLLVFTEATWFTASPAAATARFWASYEAMADEDGNRRRAAAAGYEVLTTYRLPASDWAAYYDPIAERLRAYDTSDPDVAAGVAAEWVELDLYRDHGDEYGYTGYVLRRTD
jgi:SAM-dependent methyltransferase